MPYNTPREWTNKCMNELIHRNTYWGLAWSRWPSGSRCPSPPGTCARGSSGRSRPWHTLWSCPGCCPSRPAAHGPPCVGRTVDWSVGSTDRKWTDRGKGRGQDGRHTLRAFLNSESLWDMGLMNGWWWRCKALRSAADTRPQNTREHSCVVFLYIYNIQEEECDIMACYGKFNSPSIYKITASVFL